MAKFVESSCEELNIDEVNIKNSPTNIDLIIKIVKTKIDFYPKTKNLKEIPIIKFFGIDNKSYEWIYSKNQLEERDSDFNNIINNNS